MPEQTYNPTEITPWRAGPAMVAYWENTCAAYHNAQRDKEDAMFWALSLEDGTPEQERKLTEAVRAERTMLRYRNMLDNFKKKNPQYFWKD